MKKVGQIVMWIFVGLGGAAVLVVAFGVWAMTHVGYEFPDGDLPANLAGRWDWSTETEPCGPTAHVISFADDRSTMTIAKAANGADTGWTATYDIQELSSGRLRGAIRGESRLTEAGVPVVWDLVMFGPNEYHWQQTDWQSWMYTAAVRRCGTTAGFR